MRVLMFGWEFPPHNSGGLGVACKGLAQALARQDIDIIFVLPKKLDLSDPNLKFLFADIGTAKVRGVDTALTPYRSAKEYEQYRRLFKSDIYGDDLFAETIRYAAAAGDIASEESFDVIHAHDWLSFLAGVEAKKVSGKPLIVHVHITSFDQSGDSGVDERVYAIEREGMEHADAIITVSEFTKNIVVRRYGIDPLKVHVVHNGVDPESMAIHTKSAYSNVADFSFKKPGHKLVFLVDTQSWDFSIPTPNPSLLP